MLARSRPDGIVVCNGYKDREYIRLALIGKQIGHRVYIVVEKLSELDLVIQESKALGVVPLLGVRVRLASIGAGKWQNTGGDKSKFGLSAAEVLRVIERLRAESLLESLQMMHFHMGSQIANIQHIQSGMREAARYYAELRKLGAKIARDQRRRRTGRGLRGHAFPKLLLDELLGHGIRATTSCARSGKSATSATCRIPTSSPNRGAR